MEEKVQQEISLEEVQALRDEITRLEERLQAKVQETEEYLDRLRRLYADFDNFRKRMIKEQTQILEYAKEDLVKKLLPIVDDLERALKSAEVSQRLGPLLEGVKMVRKRLLDQLTKEGLQRVEVEPGSPFDPEIQETVAVVKGDNQGDVVVELFEPGYFFKKKLLRPAKVKVAKGRAPFPVQLRGGLDG